MSVLRRILAVIDTANERCGSIVLYLIPLMVFVVTYEVIVRYVFNKPTEWAFEISQFIFCASISMGGGFALLHRRHVYVDIVYDHLKPRVRAVLAILTTPLLLMVIVVLFLQSLEATIDSYRYWERAATYWAPVLFPIYTVMTIGLILTMLQGIAFFIRSLIVALTGTPEVSGDEGGHK